jgi:fluoroquinolone resistance protein
MELPNIYDKTFTKIDFTAASFDKAEYEGCVFNGCNFSNVNLSGVEFLECEFTACDLSMVKLGKTGLKDVKFIDCKMLGLRFDQCNDFGLVTGFSNCVLNYSSFYKLKLKKTIFSNSQLQQVDFTDCDLSLGVFERCDLKDAKFENTLLAQTDFRTAYNYSIDPATNRIRKARFSLSGLAGLLDKYDIEIEKDF